MSVQTKSSVPSVKASSRKTLLSIANHVHDQDVKELILAIAEDNAPDISFNVQKLEYVIGEGNRAIQGIQSIKNALMV